MLRHELWEVFTGQFDAYTTYSRDFNSYDQYKLFDPVHSVDRVSTQDFDSVSRAIDAIRPTVVVNCIDVLKQSTAIEDPIASISANALSLPSPV